MKNLTLIISLFAIISAGILHPMKRPADLPEPLPYVNDFYVYKLKHPVNLLEPSSDLNNFYAYTCTSQGCNKSFNMESSLDTHKKVHENNNNNKTNFFGSIDIAKLLLNIHQATNSGDISLPAVLHNNHIETTVESIIESPVQQVRHRTPCMLNQEININNMLEIEESTSKEEEDFSQAGESIHPLLTNHSTLFVDSDIKKKSIEEIIPILAPVVAQSAANNIHKKFPCTFEGCNKSFAQKGDLTRHIRTHTGEKPFSCILCDKSFADRRNLKAHIRIHTGEKPYTCTFCNKSFTRNGNLKKHLQMKHTDKKS